MLRYIKEPEAPLAYINSANPNCPDPNLAQIARKRDTADRSDYALKYVMFFGNRFIIFFCSVCTPAAF